MHAAYPTGKEIVDGFLAQPSVEEARAGIVLVHGYRGLDDGQRAVTRRFAQEGFVCLPPDLFHGRTYTRRISKASQRRHCAIAVRLIPAQSKRRWTCFALR
jgi:dienelactone hydrolase